MPYRLVCLDAGFTVLSPVRSLGDALRSALSEHGHKVSDEDLRRAWDAANRWFSEEYDHSPDTWADDARIDTTWRRYHAVMLAELGLGDLHHRLIEAILAAQYAPGSWELYPDVRPAVEQLRGAGLKLGIVSDWGSNLL